ncbi:MAG TPA: hypothetical protein VIM30_13025 [Candidatus Limnocylindrales bacterium]|jgi:type I site-specific restriction endonuclease
MALSEADRAKLIDPAFNEAGWGEDKIPRGVHGADGRLYVVGNETHRRQPLWAGYVLTWETLPLAVEAKDDSHHEHVEFPDGTRALDELARTPKVAANRRCPRPTFMACAILIIGGRGH